jgi:hypothetical protein
MLKTLIIAIIIGPDPLGELPSCMHELESSSSLFNFTVEGDQNAIMCLQSMERKYARN